MKVVTGKHGNTRDGTTTVTSDRDGMTSVVKDVPAQVGTNCGDWTKDRKKYLDTDPDKILKRIMKRREKVPVS
jgi:hypothetical protein